MDYTGADLESDLELLVAGTELPPLKKAKNLSAVQQLTEAGRISLQRTKQLPDAHPLAKPPPPPPTTNRTQSTTTTNNQQDTKHHQPTGPPPPQPKAPAVPPPNPSAKAPANYGIFGCGPKPPPPPLAPPAPSSKRKASSVMVLKSMGMLPPELKAMMAASKPETIGRRARREQQTLGKARGKNSQ